MSLATAVSVGGVGLVAWACGADGKAWAGLPVFGWCAALAFVVNWAVFAPAFAANTERYYYPTGSVSYLSVTATALLASGRPDTRAALLALLVAVCALRLGVFLFRRVHADGGDGWSRRAARLADPRADGGGMWPGGIQNRRVKERAR